VPKRDHHAPEHVLLVPARGIKEGLGAGLALLLLFFLGFFCCRIFVLKILYFFFVSLCWLRFDLP
jgi:hypothetical protein